MESKSDVIRDHIRMEFIEPARRRGERRVKVVAGDVHSGLNLRNRVPLVCNALRSRALQESAGIHILAEEGPPSGLSTTVAITYEILPTVGGTATSAHQGNDAGTHGSRYEAFRRLRGVARDTFASLGGGETFLRQERDAFAGKESE